jgi:hypothetical protein
VRLLTLSTEKEEEARTVLLDAALRARSISSAAGSLWGSTGLDWNESLVSKLRKRGPGRGECWVLRASAALARDEG